LAIIDLSADGAQPMTVHCARCGSASLQDLALTYNGEIYNFPDLRTSLKALGHTFHSRTDSEVLLHLYGDEGIDMLPRLSGIFAFALRDGRERGRPDAMGQGDLLLARDPIGVKPLYHAQTPEGFLFGSEMKALLPDPGLSRELDHIALHQHLAHLWTPAPRTLLRGVRKLRPGHALIVQGGRIAREWSYYELPYGAELLQGDRRAIERELRDRVEGAVRRQLLSDVPVGAFLSGGLDSSAVVAMMKLINPNDRPLCYSIGFAGDQALDGSPPDLPYARRVAEHLDVRLHTIEVEPDMIRHLERMLFHLDEPQADPAPINTLLIAEQARRDGMKVLLSGAGGDDIFAGYRRHFAVRLERLWCWMPAAARRWLGAPARRIGEGHLGGLHNAWVRRAVRLFAHADLEPDARLAAYFWWSEEGLRRGLYTTSLAAELRDESTSQPLLESLAKIPSEPDALNRMLYLEAKHFLADHNLNYTDKMGMAAGVEVRVPLLDLDVIEFATMIPPRMKQEGRLGKAIFKRAMESHLPREVVYRPKTGFGAPLRRWLRQELREQVEETLSASSLGRRGLFDPGAVHRLVEGDRAGRVDGSYTIFALMCFELWCRRFVDADSKQTGYTAL
jgi:asparagine synthase (glutamine-hydrolysing)